MMGTLDQFDPIFQAAAEAWNLDPTLLRAVARQETGRERDPLRAVSGAGARGIMGLMPGTARGLGVEDPHDAEQNIFGGAKYLSEALDKEGSPERALLYYHGGPRWRDHWGPESAGYVPGVSAHYQRISAAGRGAAPPQPQGAATVPAAAKPGDLPSDADFLARTTAAPAPAAKGSDLPSDDDFLARTAGGPASPAGGAASGGTSPANDTGGILRNIAAGVTDVGANVANVLADPGGTIGKIPATALVFAHDALAPVLGYQRFPDDVRNMLLGDTQPQRGNQLVEAAGRLVGSDPSQVTANTDAERLTRKVVGGAGSAMLLAPGLPAVVGAGMGAGGAVAGDYAGQAAPAWAAPAAEMAGNLVGGAAAGGATALGRAAPAASAINRLIDPLARPIENFLAGAEKPSAASQIDSRIAAVKQQVADQAATPQPVPEGTMALSPEFRANPLAPELAARLSGGAGGAGGAGPAPFSFAQFKSEMLTDALHSGGLAEVERATAAVPAEYAAYQRELARLAAGGAPSTGRSWGQGIAREQVRVPGAEATAPSHNPLSVAAGPASPIPVLPPRPAANANEPRQAGWNQPEAAGAAPTPAAEAGLTPAQVQAYRSTAEGTRLLEAQQPGFADRTLYVRGSNPNEAEMEQTVNASRELKSRGMQSPEVAQEAREAAARNNEARTQHFNDLSRSPVDIDNVDRAREAQAQTDLGRAWGNKQDVDAGPVLGLVDHLLASPVGKIDPVDSALTKVRTALHNRAGELETDPERLYGARRQITYLLSKKNLAKDPSYGDPDAVRVLIAVRDALDTTIEGGAKGFRTFLDNFHRNSIPIDEMEVLQGHQNRLYDSAGGAMRMGYNRVQAMMRSIVDARASGGTNQYKSISDETMAKLWALRDDLRRSASAHELARAPGSDTAQNLWDVARNVGLLGGQAAAHAIAGYVAPVIGNVGVNMAKDALKNMLTGRTAARNTKRGLEMLNPDPRQYRNPLQD